MAGSAGVSSGLGAGSGAVVGAVGSGAEAGAAGFCSVAGAGAGPISYLEAIFFCMIPDWRKTRGTDGGVTPEAAYSPSYMLLNQLQTLLQSNL